jgi:DNA-binding transcriptional LysR family regulator
VREGLVAALPAGHRLGAGTEPLHVEDLTGEDFLMYSPIEARYFHELLVSVFRSAGAQPVFTQYLTQVHSMLALVNGGWGIALVPEGAVRMRYGGIVFRPVDLPEPQPVELDYVWRESNDNPALEALLRHL